MKGSSTAGGKLTKSQQVELLEALRSRFGDNMVRHMTVIWDEVQAKLEAAPDKLWSLYQMEQTGGEPDIIGSSQETGEYVFFDCSMESPQGRRNTCYDQAALESRKQNKPQDSAVGMADAMGITILAEEEYRLLQQFGEFDAKTSSWVRTPERIRRLGGALFCDRRYGTVFVYHNGAESYYGSRGFRGLLRV